jgi:hypothetical protein
MSRKIKIGFDTFHSKSEFNKHYRYLLHQVKDGDYDIDSPIYKVMSPFIEHFNYFKNKKFVGCRLKFDPKLNPKKRFYFIEENGNENYLNYKIYPNIYYFQTDQNQSNETMNLLSSVNS